jgi:hypothetical protein
MSLGSVEAIKELVGADGAKISATRRGIWVTGFRAVASTTANAPRQAVST